MQTLLNTIKHSLAQQGDKPFTVYSSIQEQVLLNVPIAKPMLIVVFSGEKKLGKENELICHAGEFIFLSDSPAIDMRNIPKDKAYFALLIEFDFEDFAGLQTVHVNHASHCIGAVEPSLEQCLQQFIESTVWAPEPLWSLRKREILVLLCHLGYTDILSMVGNNQISHKLHELISQRDFEGFTIADACAELSVSESTLRRRLKSEGATFQEIKDRARWGLALHLLQTTRLSVGLVAEKCGYQSQSRFTERFKLRFGLTPTDLRKTKMTDSGEIMTV